MAFTTFFSLHMAIVNCGCVCIYSMLASIPVFFINSEGKRISHMNLYVKISFCTYKVFVTAVEPQMQKFRCGCATTSNRPS